jgi:ribosomal protein L40E
MADIFDAKIVCKKCDSEMDKVSFHKNGFALRAVSCKKCGEKILHPEDKARFQKYNDLKGKTFNVKMRIVGNSHAISIPKEIVTFLNGVHSKMSREMDDMVRLCFEDFGRLSVRFGETEDLSRRRGFLDR